MERLTVHLAPHRLAERVMSTRTLAATLAPGLLFALALWAGEAAAQDVCRGGPYTGATGAQIECVDTSGSTDIVIDPGSVNVARIHGDHRAAGDIIIRIKPGVTITGSGGNSVLASRRGSGDVSIVITGGTLTGIASSTSYNAPGTVSVSMSGGTLSGRLGAARNGGTGNAYVTVSGDATIRNTGINAYGVFATNNGLGDELSVRMTGGSVETTGAGSHGIFVNASNDNGATAGPAMSVDLEGGSVRTRGNAHGVFFASYRGSRDASFRMTGGSIVTEADNVHGVDFWLRRFAAGQTASVRMTGGSIVAEGLGGRGLASLELYYGSLDVMTGAGAEIEVPFAVGMEGLLEVDASATGRLVFAHRGAVEARDVGVLAWARRSSGHTMGAGATTADDAARTMPMIHVTSSGDVTVGASVTDAFIRTRITGEDGTLSTAEQAVLSAITAGDSGDAAALTTALAALPDADYDAAWKAEAQNLLRKRAASSAAPTGNGPLAHRAAEEILGLSRAGVRAYALSHTAIVDHVRAGDALSTEERAALDAVLTKGVGSELETALTALTGATYTAAWKDTVRRFAATYNAGDIRVDVTGGSIDAEGNGVEALYAVRHDSNGAIAVTVAEGARVTGVAHGLHVRGAGAGTGGLRAQSVTVDGRVTGGTAGVHMVGGGRLTVGKTGRIGATSGVGVLSDGAGDLHATVAGTVEGDIRMAGTGALTLAVPEGGAVTGTVRDPVGLPTVVGSIGRLLYTSGATVTVAQTGALTGVEVDGRTEALRAEDGDLDVTVAGSVAGDLRAPSGGTLTLNLREGGEVTGTVHDPAGLPTVVGSIGRLLYTSGATVTVAQTGALTGVEVDGRTEALRAEDGDLDVTVAGSVAGDLRAPSGGTLTLNLREGGEVTGTVHDPAGLPTVVGSIGRLLYTSGATVTVAQTGALTGVEVDGRTEALRAEAGDLDVTVAGRVAGDLRAPSGGTLTLAVPEGGAVTGTVRDPVGLPTVVGSIGRLLYTSGATVTVAQTGALTGVEVDGRTEALRAEAGDLDVTVAGRVAGDLRAPSGGTLTLNLREGGAVTGTVHDPVGLPTVVGSIGRLLYTSGATVTVAQTGALTGVEVDGGTEALRSEAGDLDLTVAGMVTGDVFGLGAGEHTVTVSDGGTVTGTVHLAASTVRVDGRAGRVHFDDGGTVTVGSNGWITGIEGVAIRNAAGNLVVSVAGRITGDVIDLGARPAKITTESGSTVAGNIDVAGAGSEVLVGGTVERRVRLRQGGMVTVGQDGKIEEGPSWNDQGELVVVVERKPEETEDAARGRAFPGNPGGIDERTIQVKSDPAFGRGVYEALPSVLLGLNDLPGFQERMAALRSAKGAGWARVEAFRGKWQADASTSQEKEGGVALKYRHRRHGLQVGWATALGEEALLGASLHHRRGSATVTERGDIKLHGTGVGVSGTWMREAVYVDLQAEVTEYEADLNASRLGVLKEDVSGYGHALGVEAGRRVHVEQLPAGLVLTPRAGLVHSKVSMGDFTDAVGLRVSMEDARSLKGRVGVDAEMKLAGRPHDRVFGSLEVEHEFSNDDKVMVSGTELKSESAATWLRLGLNGVHSWDDGRYTVQGGVSYGTSGDSHEVGGGLSLNVRF